MESPLRNHDYSLENDAQVQFAEEINRQMTVPRHISAAGSSPMADREVEDSHRMQTSSSRNFAKGMNVPDKIRVAGGDNHVGEKQPPMEIAMEQASLRRAAAVPIALRTPPQTLTVTERAFPTVDEEAPATPAHVQRADLMYDTPNSTGDYPRSSQVLTAHEQITLMKSQLQKLNTKVFQLEQNVDDARRREYLLIMATGAYFLLKWLRGMMAR